MCGHRASGLEAGMSEPTGEQGRTVFYAQRPCPPAPGPLKWGSHTWWSSPSQGKWLLTQSPFRCDGSSSSGYSRLNEGSMPVYTRLIFLLES